MPIHDHRGEQAGKGDAGHRQLDNRSTVEQSLASVGKIDSRYGKRNIEIGCRCIAKHAAQVVLDNAPWEYANVVNVLTAEQSLSEKVGDTACGSPSFCRVQASRLFQPPEKPPVSREETRDRRDHFSWVTRQREVAGYYCAHAGGHYPLDLHPPLD